MIESATLTLAYFLDLAIGDPRWLPHPVRITGKAITKTENFLRRIIQNTKHRPVLSEVEGTQNIENPPTPHLNKGEQRGVIAKGHACPCLTGRQAVGRGEVGFEKLAGIFLVLIIVGSTYGVFFAINLFLISHFSLLTFIFLVYLISTTLATHELLKSAKSVIKALNADDIKTARKKLSCIVGRDTETLDRDGILKATVETLAENASDGIIAPLFYLSIGGLPLAMAYKAINTLDSMVGYKTEKYKNFGWASAKLDDIANYIPARITGLLIVVTTFIFNIIVRSSRLFNIVQNSSRLNNIEPLNNFEQDSKKLDGFNAIKIMIRDGRNHPSPNSGVPEAAMAGALGVRLGGPSRYGGIIVDKPYIGEDLLDSSRWLNIVQNSSSLNNVEPLNKFEQFSARSTDSYEHYLQASENAIFIVKISSFSGFCTALLIVYLKALL